MGLYIENPSGAGDGALFTSTATLMFISMGAVLDRLAEGRKEPG